MKYLQDILQQFKSKCLAMINKNHEGFQYISGDLVYVISPLTSQLRTSSRKVTIKYVGPLVIYKIVDPYNYLLITLDGKVSDLKDKSWQCKHFGTIETSAKFRIDFIEM